MEFWGGGFQTFWVGRLTSNVHAVAAANAGAEGASAEGEKPPAKEIEAEEIDSPF